MALAGEGVLVSGVGCPAPALENRAMDTKVVQKLFDRRVRPTRELDRFLFRLPTELSSLLRHQILSAPAPDEVFRCDSSHGVEPEMPTAEETDQTPLEANRGYLLE